MAYIGESRSERSFDAMNDGKLPISLITKKTILEFKKSSSCDPNIYGDVRKYNPGIFKLYVMNWKDAAYNIGACEWHHTGKYYNKTDYYDLNQVAAYLTKNFGPIEEANRKRRQARHTSTDINVKYQYPSTLGIMERTFWTGTRNYPNPHKEVVFGYLKNGWLICTDGTRHNIDAKSVNDFQEYNNFYDFAVDSNVNVSSFLSFCNSDKVIVPKLRLSLEKLNVRYKKFIYSHPTASKIRRLIGHFKYRKARSIYIFTELLKYAKSPELYPRNHRIYEDFIQNSHIYNDSYNGRFRFPSSFNSFYSYINLGTYRQYLKMFYPKIYKQLNRCIYSKNKSKLQILKYQLMLKNHNIFLDIDAIKHMQEIRVNKAKVRVNKAKERKQIKQKRVEKRHIHFRHKLRRKELVCKLKYVYLYFDHKLRYKMSVKNYKISCIILWYLTRNLQNGLNMPVYRAFNRYNRHYKNNDNGHNLKIPNMKNKQYLKEYSPKEYYRIIQIKKWF